VNREKGSLNFLYRGRIHLQVVRARSSKGRRRSFDAEKGPTTSLVQPEQLLKQDVRDI